MVIVKKMSQIPRKKHWPKKEQEKLVETEKPKQSVCLLEDVVTEHLKVLRQLFEEAIQMGE